MRMLGVMFLAAVGCVDAADDYDDLPEADWAAGKADGERRFAVTASSVEALDGDLSSLAPPCVTADPAHTCAFYLSSSSALGDYGPIGAYGPLGSLGPLGSNAWNASAWISAAGNWSSW